MEERRADSSSGSTYQRTNLLPELTAERSAIGVQGQRRNFNAGLRPMVLLYGLFHPADASRIEKRRLYL
jgi:hypothetical protein